MKAKLLSLIFALAGAGVIQGAGPAAPFRLPRVLKAPHYTPRQVYPALDVSRQALDIDRVHRGVTGNDGEIIPFDGSGVVIGIVDGGADPRHVAFRDPADDSRSRVALYIRTLSAAESESGELEYSYVCPASGEIIPDDMVDRSSGGHGTHTAGCAAGAYPGNEYSGAAPGATIAMTSMGDYLYDDEMFFGISSIMEYAARTGQPCVVSLSLATYAGPHNGRGDLTDMLNELQPGAGNIICFAAGNYGNRMVHLAKRFDVDESEIVSAFGTLKGSDVTAYGHVYGPSESLQLAFTVLYHDTDGAYEVCRSGYVPYQTIAEAGEDGLDITPLFEEAVSYFGEGLYIASAAIPEAYGREGLEVAAMMPPLDESACYALGMVVAGRPGDEVELFFEPGHAELYSFGAEGYVSGDGRNSISDNCLAPGVVSIGACNSRQTLLTFNGTQLNFDSYTASYGKIDGVSAYSSYCNEPDIFPHVVAPGTWVIGPTVDEGGWALKVSSVEDSQGQQWYYGADTGTSMSTPLVAGIIAMWLQADPTLDFDAIIDLLERSSCPMEPAEQVRFGMPSAYEGLKYIIGTSSTGNITVPDEAPGRLMMRRLSGSRWEVVMPFAAADITYELCDMAGRCVAKGRSRGPVFTVDVPAAGLYLLRAMSDIGTAIQKFFN